MTKCIEKPARFIVAWEISKQWNKQEKLWEEGENEPRLANVSTY